MPFLHQFLVDYLLNICGGILITFAVVIFRANKLRAANRAFSLLIFNGGLWMINYSFVARHDVHAIMHLRIGAAFASFFPLILSQIKILLLNPTAKFRHYAASATGWVIFALILISITPLEWFIHYDSPPLFPTYDMGWKVHHILLSSAMAYIALNGWSTVKKLPTGSRDEMAIAVVYAAGSIAVISSFMCLMGKHASLPPAEYGVVIIIYSVRLTWVLLARGVYDTRVLLSILARTTSIILGAASLFFFLIWFLKYKCDINETAATIISSVSAAALVNHISEIFLARHNALLYRSIANFQRDINEISRTALTPDKAIQRLEGTLATYTSATTAYIFTEIKPGVYQHGDLFIRYHAIDWQRINRSGWLTRDAFKLDELPPKERATLKWLEDLKISLLILAPRSEQHINTVVALGPREHAHNYTFYELECISLIAESAAGALTTIEASTQARQAGQMMALGMISASVAHEIKQPLAALRIFLKVLPSRFQDERFRHEYFDLIPRELERVEGTLAQLLRLGRTEIYAITNFNPSSHIREVITLIQPKAASASVEVICEFIHPDAILQTDPIIFKQALLNLTLNALDALDSSSSSPRQLFVTATISDQYYTINVRDTGPGIAPAILEKLFRPFVSTKEDGFGLGLYITRDQVSKTCGELTADNDPRGGATFLLRYPLIPFAA